MKKQLKKPQPKRIMSSRTTAPAPRSLPSMIYDYEGLKADDKCILMEDHTYKTMRFQKGTLISVSRFILKTETEFKATEKKDLNQSGKPRKYLVVAFTFGGQMVKIPVYRIVKKKSFRDLLPQDVVTEFLGGVELKGKDDISIAEQIASQQYNNMNDLIMQVKSYAKSRIRYDEYVESTKTHPFFEKYFI